MTDILFHEDNAVFSYRVAGICLRENRILLQKPADDPGFAFPGGHIAFGETSAETLRREFKEETGADIAVNGLRWVGEIFFPWDEKVCHQICLYYDVTLLKPGAIPETGSFAGTEQMEGRDFQMEFHWIPLEELDDILLYPPQTKAFLQKYGPKICHFIFREE